MKTSLQKILDAWRTLNYEEFDDFMKKDIDGILAAEREQIKAAFTHGVLMGTSICKNGDDYYQRTYETDLTKSETK